MKRTLILVWAWAAMAFLPAVAQSGCSGIGVRAAVEVGDDGVSLADLLTSENCSALRQAAAAVWLGNAPQAGMRTFEGSEIRQALQRLGLAANSEERVALASANIPDRIVVRRSGAKVSCSEIRDFVAGALRERTESDAVQNFPSQLECGGANHIPHGAALELTKVFWDPALRTWAYALRCARASDCVPFLVRQISSTANPQKAPPGFAPLKERARAVDAPPAVRVGQTATLYWEQDGIRAVLPVICLDHGAVGSLIRARTKNGNRILWAEVVSAGVLRASL
jgi:hypothetical protein